MSNKALQAELCLFVIAVLFLAGCGEDKTPDASPAEEDAFTRARLELVEKDIARAGIVNEDVLRAMRTVPRHQFVPSEYLEQAYKDHPLPIGYGQTRSFTWYDGKSHYGRYVSIYRDERGYYERPVHYAR